MKDIDLIAVNRYFCPFFLSFLCHNQSRIAAKASVSVTITVGQLMLTSENGTVKTFCCVNTESYRIINSMAVKKKK